MTARTVDERFWGKVSKGSPDECWPWTGYVDSKGNGYGQFWNGLRLVKAHRHSYSMVNGEIPKGNVIDHICHNNSGCTDVPCAHRRCCNPTHLESVTQSVNSIRGRSGDHQSAKTHCAKGHEYTAENTIWGRGRTRRTCRTCYRAYQKKYNDNRKAA